MRSPVCLKKSHPNAVLLLGFCGPDELSVELISRGSQSLDVLSMPVSPDHRGSLFYDHDLADLSLWYPLIPTSGLAFLRSELLLPARLSLGLMLGFFLVSLGLGLRVGQSECPRTTIWV
jgi:hypothetical protein